MKQYDVFICPSTRVTRSPSMQESDGGGGGGGATGGGWPYTGVFNSTGWPVVVVRCGSSADGKLPIGVQVVAEAMARGHLHRGRVVPREQVRRLAKAADLTQPMRPGKIRDFLARPFDEPTLFRIAAAYEAATHHRTPPPGFGPVKDLSAAATE